MATGDVVQSGFYDITSGEGYIATLSGTPAAGNTLVFWVGMRSGNITEPLSFTAATPTIACVPTQQNYTGRMWYRIVQSGDTATFHFDTANPSIGQDRVQYVELEGTLTLDTFDTNEVTANNPNPNICGNITAGSDAIALVGGIVAANNVSDGVSFTADGSATELSDKAQGARTPQWLGYQLADPAAGSYSMSATRAPGGIERGYAGALVSFTIPPTPPTPGMW